MAPIQRVELPSQAEIEKAMRQARRERSKAFYELFGIGSAADGAVERPVAGPVVGTVFRVANQGC